MSRPTPAQVAAIDYFASVVDRERPRVDTNRNFSQTTKACEDRGWIERIEEFPYHAPTEAGRAVVAAAQAGCPVSRRDPHPVDPTRRRRIEDPDEYERGRRDGRPPTEDPRPADPKPTYADTGEGQYGTAAFLAVLIIAGILLAVFGNWS